MWQTWEKSMKFRRGKMKTPIQRWWIFGNTASQSIFGSIVKEPGGKEEEGNVSIVGAEHEIREGEDEQV
jgi:hypothetical protein